MLPTLFRANWHASSGEENFLKGFYHIWAWRPSWACYQIFISLSGIFLAILGRGLMSFLIGKISAVNH